MNNKTYYTALDRIIGSLEKLRAEGVTIARGIIGETLTKDDLFFCASLERCLRLTDGITILLKECDLTCAGALLRLQMDMGTADFATFVMDELNEGTIKQIKAACHDFTVHGDFVDYKNLYQGVLTENSLYSPGIQLAVYAAGVMNGYLRDRIVSLGNYQFATDLYDEFIKPSIRCHANGKIVGHRVVDVLKRTPFRKQLDEIFDK